MKNNENSKESAGRYLCFSLGKEKFAMPLLQVKEVIANIETTQIPHAPADFKGIMNLRGQIISVIDLRAKMKVEKIEKNPETTIVILDLFDLSIGVIVDSVNSVTAFEDSAISASPLHESGFKSDYICGVARHDKELTLIIDLKKVLNTQDLVAAKEQNKKAA